MDWMKPLGCLLATSIGRAPAALYPVGNSASLTRGVGKSRHPTTQTSARQVICQIHLVQEIVGPSPVLEKLRAPELGEANTVERGSGFPCKDGKARKHV